jgi:hypothetical protein
VLLKASGYSTMSAPDVAVVGIVPIAFPLLSVNQICLSGPTARPNGRLLIVGVGKIVIVPAGVIRPTAAGRARLNQMLPSGPSTRPWIPLSPTGSGKSSLALVCPSVSMRAILFSSPYQSFPSGPTVTPTAVAVFVSYSLMRPEVVMAGAERGEHRPSV